MQGLMSPFPLTLAHVFQRAERIFPEKEVVTATRGGKERVTYGEWAERTRRLAGALDALGISEDGRVGTFAWNTARHLELYFAAPCSGRVLHTLNIRLFPDDIVYIVDHEELIGAAEPVPEFKVDDENRAAAMCYTSGTTGHPKGVVYSHRSTVLHSLGAMVADSAAVCERDTVMPVVPMFHANAWGLCQAAVMAGSNLAMPGPNMQP